MKYTTSAVIIFSLLGILFSLIPSASEGIAIIIFSISMSVASEALLLASYRREKIWAVIFVSVVNSYVILDGALRALINYRLLDLM